MNSYQNLCSLTDKTKELIKSTDLKILTVTWFWNDIYREGLIVHKNPRWLGTFKTWLHH